MGLWKRIHDWLSGSDEEAAEQAVLDRERTQGDEGLPPHIEEVIQPRQYPPSDSGVNF
jgi:hypothetical protein